MHVYTGVEVPGLAAQITISIIGSDHLSMTRMPWVATDMIRKQLLFCALIDRAPAAADAAHVQLAAAPGSEL